MAFGQPVLTGLCVDLQIHICEFLNPAEIVTLRQTCKTFHELTSERIIWIEALIRTCRENFLFVPTFPIPDMSVADLERAATAPFRWIALSSSEARDADGCLPSRTQVLPRDPKTPPCYSSGRLYLVPGGRYLVRLGPNSVNVWDLGYPSVSLIKKPIKLWSASVDDTNRFLVHPTPDGLGIRILTYSSSPSPKTAFHVFEIYPQRETPKLVRIANLILNLQGSEEDVGCTLHGDRVIIFYASSVGTVMVWDFIANAWASWSVSIGGLYSWVDIAQVTESIVCLGFHDRTLSAFQIPPLATKKPLSNSMGGLPKLAPLFSFDLARSPLWFQKPDEWYYGDPGLPSYIDMLYRSSLGRSITDYSGVPNLLLEQIWECNSITYRICGNRFVACFNLYFRMVLEVLTTSRDFDLSSDCDESSRLVTELASLTPLANASIGYTCCAFCPASCRLICIIRGKIVVCDFL